MTQVSRSITIQDAANFAEIINGMSPDEEIALTQDGKTVPRLIQVASAIRPARGFGSCKGMLTSISEDDDHLADFKDYM